MALIFYSIILIFAGGVLGFLFGSAVEKDVYKYYDAIGKLAHDDYEKVIDLLHKVRADL